MFPPDITALVDIPAADELLRAVDRSAASAQALPFHSSVSADTGGGVVPPVIKAKVVIPIPEPCPARLCRAVFISAISVQDVPFHSSLVATIPV